MFRTVLIAIVATVAATQAANQAVAQPAGAVRSLTVQVGSWAVAPVGDRTVSHCVMGLRSDASAPVPGKPQFMISADRQFAILHVRAAEWRFGSSRDMTVTLTAGNGGQQTSQAMVRGADLVDIAIAGAPERFGALAASGHLEIQTEGTTVRLPLSGIADVMPAYRDCLASVGKPLVERHAAVAIAR